ncbi:hypothetical protein KKA14_15640, partial [bacterium]|nr:hypothetical protein [bacterium]
LVVNGNVFQTIPVILLQGTFTPLVYTHAGRTKWMQPILPAKKRRLKRLILVLSRKKQSVQFSV